MASSGSKQIFFVPHQDDEFLTFGLAILRAVEDGCEVHVVLCTDGSLDDFRNQLGSGKRCYLEADRRIHWRRHAYPISVEEFVDIRDREFLAGCASLGVRPGNVHIAPHRGLDGSLTAELSKRIIASYVNMLPDAVVCTEVPIDCPLYDPNEPGYSDVYHTDHHALGNGARLLFEEGLIREVRYYADPYYLGLFKRVAPEIEFQSITPTVEERRSLELASGPYRKWKPGSRCFAVAWHSASSLFPQVTGDWNNYFYQMERRCAVR